MTGRELSAVAGLRFGHAWVERDIGGNTIALDRANGGYTELSRQIAYYALGHIDGDEVKRYKGRAALRMLWLHEHYGPWE